MDLYENKERWQDRILFPLGNRKRYEVKNIIGVDTEDNSRGSVTMAGFYNGQDYKIFKGFDKIILGVPAFIRENYLNVKKEKYYFFANNMLYDLVNLFGVEFLISGYFRGDLNLFFTKGGFVFMKWKNTYWVDLQNYYRGYSVKKLGKLIGLQKLETKSKASDVEYMKRDIELHYLAAKKLIDLLNANDLDFSFTIGSISMKTFRRKFLKRNVYRADTSFIDEIRGAYKGGRTEMFHYGKVGKVYVYDVNSLYPFIMSKLHVWRPDKIYLIDDFKTIYEDAIYYCKVNVPYETKFPILTKDDTMIFPTGVFKTYATGRELKESGAEILDIYWAFGFEPIGRIFEDFVKTFYKKRLHAKDKFEKTFYKLILNNLYGKFGQGRYKIVIRKSKLSGYIFDEILTEKYESYANLIWAIQITSEARLYMWKIMNRLNDLGIKIYYTDTDSVHTDRPIPDDLISQTKLGKLKLEGEYEQATYFAEKEYILGDWEKVVCKGVPEEVRKSYFKNGYVEFEKPVKFREGLRLKKKVNSWEKVMKYKQPREPKRITHSDGSTEPIYYNEDIDFF